MIMVKAGQLGGKGVALSALPGCRRPWKLSAVAVKLAAHVAARDEAVHADPFDFVAILIQPDGSSAAGVATVRGRNLQSDFAPTIRADDLSEECDTRSEEHTSELQSRFGI